MRLVPLEVRRLPSNLREGIFDLADTKLVGRRIGAEKKVELYTTIRNFERALKSGQASPTGKILG
jgi:hypothetical protein